MLSTKEIFDVIYEAIKHEGENLDVTFHHQHSAPGSQGIHTTLECNGQVFSINFPYAYFESDRLPHIDDDLGIKDIDDTEVKAELRCMHLIRETCKTDIIDGEGLVKYINEAILRVNKNFNLQISVRADRREIAAKYVDLYFTSELLPKTSNHEKDRYTYITFRTSDYYNEVGKNPEDEYIGIDKLKGRNKHDVCLLRIALVIYMGVTNWLQAAWPEVYKQFKAGKF